MRVCECLRTCVCVCVHVCVRNEKIKFQFTSITGSVKATDSSSDSRIRPPNWNFDFFTMLWTLPISKEQHKSNINNLYSLTSNGMIVGHVSYEKGLYSICFFKGCCEGTAALILFTTCTSGEFLVIFPVIALLRLIPFQCN